MKKEMLSPAELATKIVGDGKKPNKYFVSIGYGYYRPKQVTPGEDEECKQAPNALDSVIMGPFTSRAAAEAVYQSIKIDTDVPEVTGQTLSYVCMEDRLTGTVKDKTLAQRRSYGFFVDEIE
jgi:hypothetical protein